MKIQILASIIFATSIALAENPDQESAAKIQAAREQIEAEFGDALLPEEIFDKSTEFTLFQYNHVDPKRWVPSDLLAKALLYFDKNKSKFKNQNYITVVNLGARSNNYRLFVINIKTGAVERYRTSHGEGSDANRDGYAESFGNVPESKKSSIGYARTAEVYYGAFGRSLRLDGLSKTNSRIRERAIVFHGWKPNVEANQLQPLSWGCVTIALPYRDAFIDKIKNGSLMLVDTAQ